MDRKIISALGLIAAIVALWLFKPQTNVSQNTNQPKVAATIFPLYDIVRSIAGDEIEVILILPPGASPHTFDPTPQEIKKTAGTKAVFAIGHGVDDWVSVLAKSASTDEVVIVDRGVQLLSDNPHYWLSVKNAKTIANNVADELIRLQPDEERQIEANKNKYLQQLDNLETNLRDNLEGKNIKFATFHNAWDYLAHDYDINIIATFEEFPGEEPTPLYLAGFSNKIRNNGVDLIFVEPQFSSGQIEAVASDLEVELSELDPLGGIKGRTSYVELMLYNLNQILISQP